ncbi:hypothetical protein JWJ88_01330 [Paracoccus methylovorus]|uniref:Copper chaperone PCu(A)C n=1 Tax=Paracoccus methylovorus TaxID=2812658 RepID=A0ABX7JIZ2_9RHOB|nr:MULTISPECIES: hypothetical protein [Paracoccus]QRZ13333.1 hypothetical protein JWJ88_01330 [Paracoccus methylovorus]
MDRSIPMLLIGLIFGGGMGFVIAAANGITLDGHDHGGHGHSAQGMTHDHGPPIDLPPGSATISARLEPDSVSGWNLFIQAQGFGFAPEHAGLSARMGEGHAHLYLNGTKVARLYGPAHHLDALAPQDRLLVELTSNDHRPLTVAGQPLAVGLTVPERPVTIRAEAEGLPDPAICATP